ncbi:large conductance mechanosensitive channel [Hydrobacter penzbergensis]|jgi:large conductance mechanosensitive channel|uniref:Large-conductance mechanosensitive channel n=1 Tax=Hydrobacter penzbergensis TaxID=1235997 RepID=A0A8X8IEA4_9BACT|nr:large conductance mechanosensitive channel protein MscL [Hydrobacter penzbergensis]MBN8719331.1 large conductance mechanosensitive channel protein MscL [Sediminibacterium magnilacihabitans]PQV60634.1 large conductance mechanosensitive channel [Sediminibacterium magnilacihabitans]SDW36474.1 large conductance mechanosensitive channel [Hydrobacter penzbergensis]
MGFVKEFKEFATKGNVMDLAVGVIIGAAFGKIVDSVVNDLIMPIVGIIFKADFSNLYVALSDKITPGLTLAEAKKLGPVFAWGNFVTVVLNFIILAFVIFMLIKGMNRLKRKEEAAPAAPPAPTTSEKLLTEIRDALRK